MKENYNNDINGMPSSMRKNVNKIVDVCIYSIVATVINDILATILKYSDVDKTGTAAVIGALGVVLGMALGSKAYQRKQEKRIE